MLYCWVAGDSIWDAEGVGAVLVLSEVDGVR